MAKTRAQRKAERRRRQQAEQRRLQSDPAAEQEERGQEDTRLGVSGEVAEAEAAIETGARVDEYGERVAEKPGEIPDGTCRARCRVPSKFVFSVVTYLKRWYLAGFCV